MPDHDIFCEAVESCKTGMYTLAYGILRNDEDTGDVLQDAILKAYRHYDQLQESAKFKSWMLSIVHNTAVEYLRRQKHTVSIECASEIKAANHAPDTDTKITVWQAVQSLRQPYRTVIVLFYYDSLSAEEIAGIVGKSPAAVRQYLSRGRKMLAQILHEEDFYDENL